MKKEIRDERERLYRESLALRNIANKTAGEKGIEIRGTQTDMYNKWLFYTNIIKADDKIKNK